MHYLFHMGKNLFTLHLGIGKWLPRLRLPGWADVFMWFQPANCHASLVVEHSKVLAANATFQILGNREHTHGLVGRMPVERADKIGVPSTGAGKRAIVPVLVHTLRARDEYHAVCTFGELFQTDPEL